MVKVYMSTIDNLPDPKERPDVMDGFSKARKEKILRYTNPQVRKQGLGASLLLQHVLQLHNKSMEDIKEGSNGKPEIDGLHFNLSHSHDVVACAVSDAPVGCDVEKITKMREKIASHFFCESELDYLNQFEGERRDDEFFRLWTMKESYMKMTGEGMKLSLKRIEFFMEEPIRVYRDGVRDNCKIKEYELKGYKLTVCGMEEGFSKEMIHLKNS